MASTLSPWWSAARYTALVATWLLCAWFVWERAYHARHEFDDPNLAPATGEYLLARLGFARPSPAPPSAHNTGAAQIDFGGQWTMARLFRTDGGRLYRRDRQREVVTAAYPDPGEAEAMMGWFMGADPPAGDGIGGPLYPPVHGLLYSPLGLLEPQPAYRVFQLLSSGFAVFAGLAISRATGGRVWTPLAVTGVLAFPGGRGGLDLGQNHFLTLAILAGGWWAMTRGRWLLGGAVWGLLAFKPVWAVAFLPVLPLMGRWRAAVAMGAVAAVQIALTLPVVGVGGWLDWLAVGQQASATYSVNVNWINLSRDLAGLSRRLLLDFNVPESSRANPLATQIGWCLWATVVLGTAVVYWLQRDRRPFGMPAGFLLLGAYLACYRFMYYDAALATLPIGLMLADRRTRRAWLPLAFIGGLYLYENWLMHYRLEVVVSQDATTGRYNASQPGRRLLTLAGNYQYAWDTALLLGLWLWAGVRLVIARCRGEDGHTSAVRPDAAEGVEGGGDVGRPH